MPRLPNIWNAVSGAADNNNWGQILNDYLRVEHNADGTHGSISISVGSEAAPSLTFTGDTNTGLRSSAADTLEVVTGGADRWRINASGHLLAVDDNIYDIGASGATRPRDLFLAGSAAINGNVGIGTTTPAAQLHLYSTTGSANQILQSTSAINWVTSVYRGSGREWQLGVGGANLVDGSANKLFIFDNDASAYRLFVDTSGNVFVGDTANANMTTGLTLNQGTNDNQILALKSSDVAHGLTTSGFVATETDDFMSVQKLVAAEGGTLLQSVSENPAAAATALRIAALGGEAGTTASTTALALIDLAAAEHDGANGLVNAPANSLIFGVSRRVAGAWNNAFLIDAEGDLLVDGSTTLTAFDHWDDLALVRAFDRERTPDQLIRSVWDEHVQYSRADLERAGVLTAPTEGRAMVNITQLQRLHNGALWQLYIEQRKLAFALADVRSRLAVLTDGRM